MKKTARPVGRPSSFTQEIADTICQRLTEGESLRAICDAEEMPSQSMVFRWLAADAQFREKYARAREASLQAYEEDILQLSEDALTYIDKEGNKRIDQGDVQRRKLRADNLKWIMSKLAPKKYGDKLAIGGDGDSPLVVEHITRKIVEP
jgi:replicative DNA helicase